MNEKKEKYFKEEFPFPLKDAKYPIFFMKMFPTPDQKSSFFIVSTIDLHLYLLTYDNEKKFQTLHQDKTLYPVC